MKHSNRTSTIKSNNDRSTKKSAKPLTTDLFWSFISGYRAELFLFALTTIIYFQTVKYEYSMDDAIVITDNMFTNQGIKGIPGIFEFDTFYGYFKEAGNAQLVSGGRYRPFTLAMFAIEKSLFGSNPFFGHLINILFFAFTNVFLFRIFKKLFSIKLPQKNAWSIAFISVLLFSTHPIHSEVVANIKGRDEIMSLTGCLLGFWFGMKWVDTEKISFLVLAFFSYFTALLSKENAVSLLVIFPAALFIFKEKDIRQSLIKTIPFFVVFIIFFVIRFKVLNGTGFSGQLSNELLNNPFLKWEKGEMIPYSFSEKLASVFYCLGMYLKLLLFPHPLTHDYYPRQIPITQLTNVWVVISFIVNLILFIGTIRLTLKRKILGFAGLIYFVPLIIISNLFFPIGTNMGERFVYISSLGFCIAVALLINELFINTKESKAPVYLAILISVVFSVKTIARNPAWRSNLTLFETDIKTSGKSAKLNNSIGSEYIKIGGNSTDINDKNFYINKGIEYLEIAIAIHPKLLNAYLNLGNAEVYKDRPELAINYFNKALEIDSSFKDGRNNIAIAYRLIGRKAGEIEQNVEKSYINLIKSYYFNPNDIETLRLLGIVYGIKGEHTLSIEYLTKVLNTDTVNAEANYNLGLAYKASGNIELGNTFIERAIQLNPTLLQNMTKQK